MPAQTTAPALRTVLSASGTRAPTGAKMMAASSFSGGVSSEPPAQTAPSFSGEVLAAGVASPGEGEHGVALFRRHLRQDVGGRAEAVKAQILDAPGAAQRDLERAPADQPGAEQRRQRGGVPLFAKREGEARVRDAMGCVAAIAGIAGEFRGVAEVFVTRQAGAASLAGMAEPGYADPFAERKAGDAGAEHIDAADDFMAGNDRQARIGQFAVVDVQIGATDAAGLDPEANLAGAGQGVGPLVVPPAVRQCGSGPLRTWPGSRR